MLFKKKLLCVGLSCFVMCVCIIVIGLSYFDVVDKNGWLMDKIKNFCVGVMYMFVDFCKIIMKMYGKKYVWDYVEVVVIYWGR